MKKLVLSLGGSILIPSLESNSILNFASVLKELSSHVQIFAVVGGGGEARRYIRTARSLGMDQSASDDIGIQITRVNASLLIGALGDAAYPRVATDYREAMIFGGTGKIVVMGGMAPAQTTDAVAAVLAEFIRGDVLINATSVDGIYSADPKKDPAATRYEAMTPDQLIATIMNAPLDAGANTVVDILAAKVIQRSKIPLVVLDGRDPLHLKQAVLSGTFRGTIVSEGKNPPLPL